MIVTVSRERDSKQIERALVAQGLWVTRFEDAGHVHFAIAPHSNAVTAETLRAIDGIEHVAESKSPHPLVDVSSRDVIVRGRLLDTPTFVAGPCCVESEEQIHRVAGVLAARGVRVLRGGAFKPRSSPYSFQGHGAEALGWMRAAADAHDMAVVTELVSSEDADRVARVADIVQVGSRSMHVTSLLRAAASTGRPVLLKRGMSATIEEWLLAGEYLYANGAPSVIFCERGIRSFDPATRNVLDLGAVALLAHVHHLPVWVDPSHAAGRRDLIPALGRAALAVGATGLIVEVHDRPQDALSDGPQALRFEDLDLMIAPTAAIGGHS